MAMPCPDGFELWAQGVDYELHQAEIALREAEWCDGDDLWAMWHYHWGGDNGMPEGMLTQEVWASWEEKRTPRFCRDY